MEDLHKKYKSLEKELKPIIWNRFSEDNIFNCHLTAAYSKAFEFNVTVNKKSLEKNSFFLSPSLRGICEDLIVLKFLKKHQDKVDSNKILQHYMFVQLIEICDKQVSFFKKNHSQQIVFDYPDGDKILQDNLENLKKEWTKIGLSKERSFPTISHMATDSGLVELYNYLYSATSDMVHFSPHILMRSGWSGKEDKFLHRFSTKNFFKYYRLFNQFYGSYLFVLLSESFKKDLKLSKTTLGVVKKIKDIIFQESRWPELVTFEEMNIPDAEKIRMINVLRKIMTAHNKS